MPTIGSELLGPVGVTVVVLLAFWATFVREPPLAYSRQRYVEMEHRALKAEASVDYFAREAIEARLEQQQDAKVLELVAHRIAPPKPTPHDSPPGVWDRPFEPNRGDP